MPDPNWPINLKLPALDFVEVYGSEGEGVSSSYGRAAYSREGGCSFWQFYRLFYAIYTAGSGSGRRGAACVPDGLMSLEKEFDESVMRNNMQMAEALCTSIEDVKVLLSLE